MRWLYPHGAVRRVLRGPLRGMRFVVQPAMGAAFALGVDSYNFHFFRRRIRRGQHVWDVGANCGQMALLFARLVGAEGSVISFEPVPRNFDFLRRNLELNACGQVEPRQVAMGRMEGQAAFHFREDRHTQGGFVLSSPGAASEIPLIQVPCDTLDRVMAERGAGPALLKIDVEGGGGEVLAGARTLIEQEVPDIYFEVHAAAQDSPELCAIRELRDRFDYSVQDLDGRDLTVLEPGWGYPVWLTDRRRAEAPLSKHVA